MGVGWCGVVDEGKGKGVWLLAGEGDVGGAGEKVTGGDQGNGGGGVFVW